MHKICTKYPDLMGLDKTVPEFKTLHDTSRHRFFDNRSLIYALREPSESVYQVVEGIVIKSITGTEDKRQVLDFKFKDAIFGFTGYSTFELQAAAIGKVHLIQYPMWALNEALNVSPELVMQINTILMRDIEWARYHTFTVGKCNARQAIARFLIDLSLTQTETPHKTHTITLPMRRSDIADYLGLTIETVSRMMSSLRKKGMIDFSNPYSVTVLDWNDLDKTAFSIET